MRFRNADTERHFVEMQSDMLARNVFRGSLACAAAFLIVMASLGSQELTSVRDDGTWRLNFIAAATCMGTSVLVAAAAKMRCVLRLLSPEMREVVVVTLMLVLAVLQFALDPWYGAKMLQYELDPSSCQQGNFSDTRPVLVLSILVLASHLALPIRWICLLPFEVALGVVYAAFAFVLGGPDGVHAWSTFMLIQGLIVCAVIGRRTIEDHQRLTFCTIINERNMRAQSEFELEHNHGRRVHPGGYAKGRDNGSDAVSRPETTTSCLAFENHDDATFGDLVDLGHREQWYVKSDELKVHKRVLGQGSYGLVVEGEYHGSPVAIKINKLARHENDHLSDEDRIMSSLNEVRIMRRLRHPNIALLHGVCLDAGHENLAIILERISGKTLEEMILEDQKKMQLRPSDRLQALFQISCAIRYLHSREPPVVHGDFKASNIIAESVPGLDGFHRMKLLDFGLARSLTRHAMPLGGTLIWMAPELVASPGHRPQISTDVFSFGRLAFFVLTGIMAMAKMTRDEIIKCIERGKLPAQPWPPNLESSLAVCRTSVDQCVEFQASARPSMETVGIFFQAKTDDPFGEAAAAGHCGAARGSADESRASFAAGFSEQETRAADGPRSSDRSLTISDTSGFTGARGSSLPRSFDLIPGTLADGAHGSGGSLPARSGRHLSVLPEPAAGVLS